MSTTKLSVTVELQGSTMVSSQECEQNPENYEQNKLMLSVKHYDKKTRKYFFRTEPLYFNTRKCIPAHQVLNMSEEAYNYMTSQACPEWYALGINKWKKLSELDRLEAHLDRTCKFLGGSSYTYHIFGD